ncbi:protein-export chaperone SecB [Methylomagnum sp.]
MAEEVNQAERQFGLQKIYVKDVSFETPHSPEVFTLQWEPKMEFNLASNARQLQDGVFEVNLTVTLTAKVGDKTAYLVEVCQSGIFSAAGFSDQEYGHLLGAYCPNLLFPYARETVSDLVVRGGFPPMLLAPVNFDALYAQHLQQAQQQAESATSH